MLPESLQHELQRLITEAKMPREAAVDVLYALQQHYGYLCDEAMHYAAKLLDMTTLELESLPPFTTISTAGRSGATSSTSAIRWCAGCSTRIPSSTTSVASSACRRAAPPTTAFYRAAGSLRGQLPQCPNHAHKRPFLRPSDPGARGRPFGRTA